MLLLIARGPRSPAACEEIVPLARVDEGGIDLLPLLVWESVGCNLLKGESLFSVAGEGQPRDSWWLGLPSVIVACNSKNLVRKASGSCFVYSSTVLLRVLVSIFSVYFLSVVVRMVAAARQRLQGNCVLCIGCRGAIRLGLGLISVCLQSWSAFVLDQGQVLVVPDFGLQEGCEEAAGHLFGR